MKDDDGKCVSRRDDTGQFSRSGSVALGSDAIRHSCASGSDVADSLAPCEMR
jgi:hypothetical protein